MAELVIRFDLRFDPRVLRLGMAGAALLAMAPELASESVNLTTYYPAPSGVYSNLTVTGNAYLARDAGGVSIGTTATPAAGVDLVVVQNAANGNNPTTTRVGIGTTAPEADINATGVAAMLDVEGQVYIGNNAGTGGLTVTGTAQSWRTFSYYGATPEIYANGDNHAGGGIAVSDDGGFIDYNDGWIRYNGSTGLWIDGNSGPGSAFAGSGTGGTLMVGNAITAGATGFPGNNPFSGSNYTTVDSIGIITSHQPCGAPVAWNSLAGQACPGGQYATTIAGVFAEYIALGNDPGADTGNASPGDGTMLCCPCPASGGCGIF